MTCPLSACRVCTGCAHSHHDACRGTVRCPTDLTVRRCTCCGPTDEETTPMTITFDREYRTADKAGWGPGPWQDEPDKAQWVDPVTGLDCLIVRNGSGALCGYVGLSPEHPWHGKGYNTCLVEGCAEDWCYEHSPDGGVRVHGGLTFADACANTDDESRHICHVPLPGRAADVWWFGFDCSHSGDVSPAFARDSWVFADGEYRDVSYVVTECVRLAEQLAAVGTGR